MEKLASPQIYFVLSSQMSRPLYIRLARSPRLLTLLLYKSLEEERTERTGTVLTKCNFARTRWTSGNTPGCCTLSTLSRFMSHMLQGRRITSRCSWRSPVAPALNGSRWADDSIAHGDHHG